MVFCQSVSLSFGPSKNGHFFFSFSSGAPLRVAIVSLCTLCGLWEKYVERMTRRKREGREGSVIVSRFSHPVYRLL
jgi:hypothetical protein